MNAHNFGLNMQWAHGFNVPRVYGAMFLYVEHFHLFVVCVVVVLLLGVLKLIVEYLKQGVSTSSHTVSL